MGSHINSREFTVVGQLSDDCRNIELVHHRPLKRLVSSLIGEKLEVTFKKLRYSKSLAQLRWLWGVAYIRIAAFLKETQGVSYSKEEIHDHATQIIWNNGSTGKCVVFEEREFDTFVREFEALASDPDTDRVELLKKVRLFAQPMTCNVQVREILGKRVVVQPEIKRVSKATTVEFNQMKEELQKYWGDLDCDIPDPRENNMLEDYIDE